MNPTTVSLAEQICLYYQNYQLKDVEQFLQTKLPELRLLYPLQNPAVLAPFQQFYHKFYANDSPRTLILGINPGRLGAGLTGIQFTDTLQLQKSCGIAWPLDESREPSSTFIYKMIYAFAQRNMINASANCSPSKPLETETAVAYFAETFLLQSLLPLGFVRLKDADREVNYNFYDQPELLQICRSKIVEHLQTLISWGCRTDFALCLGSGKNLRILQQINKEHSFFGEILALEHPRYIMQYKFRQREDFLDKYCNLLARVATGSA